MNRRFHFYHRMLVHLTESMRVKQDLYINIV